MDEALDFCLETNMRLGPQLFFNCEGSCDCENTKAAMASCKAQISCHCDVMPGRSWKLLHRLVKCHGHTGTLQACMQIMASSQPRESCHLRLTRWFVDAPGRAKKGLWLTYHQSCRTISHSKLEWKKKWHAYSGLSLHNQRSLWRWANVVIVRIANWLGKKNTGSELPLQYLTASSV